MSDCEKYIELISQMADGELDEAQSEQLHTHIAECADCKRVFEAFSGLSEALSSELVEPPEMLAKGIMFKINNQKRHNRRFGFGKFTALAACLALALFGAAHYGLLGSLSSDAPMAAKSVSPDESTALYAAPPAPESGEGSKALDQAQDAGGVSETQMLTAAGDATLTCADGAELQLGFPEQNLALENGKTAADIEKEPVFLLEAKLFSVYEGKYAPDGADAAKNVLLFSVDDENNLKTFTELLTAVPENADEYTIDSSVFKDGAPLFTIFVPADKTEDENAKDKLICVWYVDNEMWCIARDVPEKPDSGADQAEKILYKAAGQPDKLDALVTKLKNLNKKP